MMTDFKNKIRDAKSILLVNPRGLGDVIHSLPIVAMLKRTLPRAQVDCLASAHSEDLFAIVPAVRQVLSVPFYPRPKSTVQRYGRRLKAAWRIRQNGYDAIINLQAINSTSKAIALSRARYKLALRGILSPIGKPWLHSDVVDRRWRNQSAHRFMLENLAAAGFAVDGLRAEPGADRSQRPATARGRGAPIFSFQPIHVESVPPIAGRRIPGTDHWCASALSRTRAGGLLLGGPARGRRVPLDLFRQPAGPSQSVCRHTQLGATGAVVGTRRRAYRSRHRVAAFGLVGRC